jgi:uncharacterized protein (DUF2062 family)
MFIKKHLQKTKEHFQEVLETKTSPHSIALGFAIGTCIVILPTFGFNILLGFLIIALFGKINKFALFGAYIIWNPLTILPLYSLSYKVGSLLFKSVPVQEYDLVIWDHIYSFTRRFLVGNILVAITAAIASYIIVYQIVKIIYKKEESATNAEK